jgi:hypothetical protein
MILMGCEKGITTRNTKLVMPLVPDGAGKPQLPAKKAIGEL